MIYLEEFRWAKNRVENASLRRLEISSSVIEREIMMELNRFPGAKSDLLGIGKGMD
ncbi:hypothetical protein GCM10027454_21030 [Algoriphagus aestuariicola]